MTIADQGEQRRIPQYYFLWSRNGLYEGNLQTEVSKKRYLHPHSLILSQRTLRTQMKLLELQLVYSLEEAPRLLWPFCSIGQACEHCYLEHRAKRQIGYQKAWVWMTDYVRVGWESPYTWKVQNSWEVVGCQALRRFPLLCRKLSSALPVDERSSLRSQLDD